MLEVLIVLSILSILITLSVPISKSLFEKQEEKQFLNTLESDILYIQNLSLGTRSRSTIEFHKDHYTIFKTRTEKPIIRYLPKNWQITYTTYKHFYFVNGTINKAGHILIQKNNENLQIVFPLGRGRGYIRE